MWNMVKLEKPEQSHLHCVTETPAGYCLNPRNISFFSIFLCQTHTVFNLWKFKAWIIQSMSAVFCVEYEWRLPLLLTLLMSFQYIYMYIIKSASYNIQLKDKKYTTLLSIIGKALVFLSESTQ
jgi:hypothetical protein